MGVQTRIDSNSGDVATSYAQGCSNSILNKFTIFRTQCPFNVVTLHLCIRYITRVTSPHRVCINHWPVRGSYSPTFSCSLILIYALRKSHCLPRKKGESIDYMNCRFINNKIEQEGHDDPGLLTCESIFR